MIKQILFASDFSFVTDKAEKFTMEIAKAIGAKVTLVHSIEPVEDADDNKAVADFVEGRKNVARNKATAVLERFAKEGVEAQVAIEVGKRWQVILDTAAAGSYDLVILGSHKVRDGDKVFLGTTTHKVFFAADMPLLVVPSI